MTESFQNFLQTYAIQYNEFFLTCFKYFPLNYFESSKFYSNIRPITQIITSYIISKYVIFTDQENDLIASIAFMFLECFAYSLPPFINVDPKSYSDNITAFDEKDEDFHFVVRSKKCSNIQLNNDEIINDFIKNGNEDLKLARAKYYETKKEIQQLYPNLKNEADNICFDTFLNHHYFGDKPIKQSNIFNAMALYKIECWQIADEIAKDNKYFD